MTPRDTRQRAPSITANALETTMVLIERARNGEPAAFERLVQRFHAVLTRFARGRLGQVCRPLDDTQSVVLETLQCGLSRLESFEYRREGAFLAYLRTILNNKIRDKYRKAVTTPQCSVLPPNLQAFDDPAANLAREEFWQAYDAAVSTLPERMREAVVLRLEAQWSYARIAEAIGSPTTNAARMYVTRGIRRLAEEMNDARC